MGLKLSLTQLNLTFDYSSLNNLLTLPLSEEWVFYNTQFFTKICGNVLKLYYPLLYSIPDEVISDFNVLRSIMEDWILRQLDTALIVTVNYGGIQFSAKQVNKSFPEPNGFTTSLAGSHVLSFC
jgi:hypothetical protein